MGKRNERIVIWRRTRGGGRVGQTAFRSRRTGSIRKSSRITASFEADQDFDLGVDSRHLTAAIGNSLMRHFKLSIRADSNPETGRKNPTTYQTPNGHWQERSEKTPTFMLGHLRRTNMDSVASWGGAGKQISLYRSRMKFYFDDPRAAAINKYDSTRKGGERAFYLGLGGSVQPILGRELGLWMDRVLSGHEFKTDTKSEALGHR